MQLRVRGQLVERKFAAKVNVNVASGALGIEPDIGVKGRLKLTFHGVQSLR